MGEFTFEVGIRVRWGSECGGLESGKGRERGEGRGGSGKDVARGRPTPATAGDGTFFLRARPPERPAMLVIATSFAAPAAAAAAAAREPPRTEVLGVSGPVRDEPALCWDCVSEPWVV
jgi:hypothetical protein